MSPEDALRIALTGISYGMILFLIASGLSLVLGAMGVLNLTHGSLYMLGAFFGLTIAQRFGGDFWLAALLSGLSVGVFGLILERLFLRRLYRQFNDQVLLTLGFVSILSNLALWTWGAYPLLGNVPPYLNFSIQLGSLGFPVYRLVLIVLGLAIAAGLWWLQERTRAGAIVRAGMDDQQMTLGLGINYRLVSSAVFFLGAAVAGFAGHLGAPITSAGWDMGFPTLILALIVVVIGGVGRVEGTLAGALVIGLIDSLGKTFFPEFAQFTIYLFFIGVLLFRPTGLFGRLQFGAAPPPDPVHIERRGPARQFAHPWQDALLRYAPWIAIGALFLLLPPFVAPYLRTWMTQILIYGLFALSLNILFGYTGLFSLGHAAFFGVAAYTVAIFSTQLGITSFWVTLPAAMLVAVLLAAVFGLIALRVSGVYFLFVTLALGELLAAVALRWVGLTGGSNGIFAIPYPDVGLPIRMNPTAMYYLTLVVFAVSIVALWRIKRSPFGLALQGIRDDEGRMRQLGYNTWLFKYLAFLVSGLFAGVAGALFAPFSGTVVPAFLGAATSSVILLMIIIGSARLFFGPVLGAALILFLEYYASLYIPERWPLVLGVVFVLTVLFLPGGIGLYLARWWDRIRYLRVPTEARSQEARSEGVGVRG